MNDVKKFVARWNRRGYEKGETHSFWLSFLRDVLGVSEPEKFIRFEVPVKLKHISFIGARIMNAAQKADINSVFDGWKNAGNLDYVSGWYKKAADFCHNKNIRAAFVSTNSICQGDSVATLWKPLFNEIHIDFAHRTFRWDSESTQKAHVHCVIVGFSSAPNDKPKIIFDGDKKIFANNINAYLLDADNIFVESRPNHIQDFVPAIGIGNKPIDNGNYLFTLDEMNDFISREPRSQKYFRK